MAASVALIIGYPCLRLRGPYFAVITLCFAFIVDLIVKNWGFLGGSEGIHLKLVQTDIQLSRSIFYEIFLGLALSRSSMSAVLNIPSLDWGSPLSGKMRRWLKHSVSIRQGLR